MECNKNIKTILITLILASLMISSATLLAQHRGDNLSFQGFGYKDNLSTKASAMAGAVTAVSGDISSLFYNPAGLAGIEKLQISFNVKLYNRHWRENQDYRPNNAFSTLPLYFEGLYIPLRENSGRWDYDLSDFTTRDVNLENGLHAILLTLIDQYRQCWPSSSDHR